MKSRIIVVSISFYLLLPLLNGCGKEEQGGHFSGGGVGGDHNYEQQALKMEQDDLNKLKQAQVDAYSKDFAKIHEGVAEVQDPNETIAIVNGDKIIRLELDKIFEKVKSKVGSSRRYRVEKRILEDLITQLLLKQFIKKENIHVDQDLIAEEIEKFRENLKSNPDTKDKSLETVLGEQGGSVEELRVALDISFSIDEYLNSVVKEEELKEYFSKNIRDFNGEKVTASHILIDTSMIEADEEKMKEAKEKIDKIKEELDSGGDFVKLAKEHSNCPSAITGGNLGVFGSGEMVKTLTDAAFNTDVNSISAPIKTRFGYHIIKVTDKQAGNDITFEETKEKVKIAYYNVKTISLIKGLSKTADTQILLKEPPSSHGSYGGHGSMSGGHGGMPAGHGGPSGASPHGQTNKKVEDSFSLTN